MMILMTSTTTMIELAATGWTRLEDVVSEEEWFDLVQMSLCACTCIVAVAIVEFLKRQMIFD